MPSSAPWSGSPVICQSRSFVMNHLIHHRAQLGLYLRLNDVPVPSIYGPSADENPMGVGEANEEEASPAETH